MAQKTLINGQAYSFVDAQFSIGNIALGTGFLGLPIKSISYNADQQKSMNYENSKYPTSYSLNKITTSGSVSFTLDTMEVLRDAIFDINGTRSIKSLAPTDIVLTFINKGKTNVHTIKSAIFSTENYSGSEGDDTMQITCDFIAANIDFGDKTVVTATVVTDNQQ